MEESHRAELCAASIFFQLQFPHVEKQWKSERHPYQQNGQHRQPAPRNTHPQILHSHKNNENRRRNQHVHAKKRADSGGKEFASKER